VSHLFIQSNNSGSSGTGSTPKGLTVQNGDTIFLATIKDIQISHKGKKLVQETTKYAPSAIAANPAVSGEFAVGAEVVLFQYFTKIRITKYTSTATPAPHSTSKIH